MKMKQALTLSCDEDRRESPGKRKGDRFLMSGTIDIAARGSAIAQDCQAQ
jgi:hypothetical protein